MLDLRPIVVNSTIMVLGGNMRLAAAKSIGLKTIPILLAEDLTEEQQNEFIVKDNLGYGDWDFEMLRNDWDTEQLSEWGLEIPELTEIPSETNDDGFETVDPNSVTTKIVSGDIIEIGRHRLMCGDSTNAGNVSSLLSGNEPRLLVTDPPYGVEYDAAWRNETLRTNGTKQTGRATGKVTNDDEADWTEAWSLAPCKVAYVYHAGKYSSIVQKSLEDNAYIIRNQIIWAKSHHAISRGDYNWKHEPCWYAVKKGATAEWCGDSKQTTLWEIAKPQSNDTGHSTQKPVECMGRPITNHKGDVYDPFIGSGTTMVAAHQLGRTCYGMEINPQYCQIVIDRMLKLDPELIIKNKGNTKD